MALKKYRPTSAGRRDMSVVDYSQLTRKRPERRLTSFIKNAAGRSSAGKIAVRHRGGGAKRLFRFVDFNQADKLGIPATIKALEYDPNRTAFIALAVYADGEKRYILAEQDMKVGDVVVCDVKAKVKKGNRMHIQNIPEGYTIFNVEMSSGKGGQIARGAGMSSRVVSLEGKYAQIMMPSGEIRFIAKNCFATIGQSGNSDHVNVNVGKAGRSRWMRKRPQVRGKVMNPVDHPHGGGEGSNSIGLKYPKTPWGKPALGVKTRRRKITNGMIVRSRKKK
ncbi:50S ribosomal protein L2 [Candidatus Gracilibacteria bacterium CG17_big_fil_post_rev_8_21_14_2_50_48_13]|nr:MAG: 50S ribosomal protein L2 [Candidatus Gracilibacteria bacterium CG17_big_fil_post_rev_8_21_14_2_50_48_13]